MSGPVDGLHSSFDDLLYSTVIEGLKRIMGSSGLIATKYHLKLDERTFEAQKFHSGLTNMFHVGSGAIEQVILQQLYDGLGVPFKERDGYEFPQYVELARKIYADRNKQRTQKEMEK
ncbi:MAG: hypothetical protein JRN20_18980 [Nitrososphaerota archaeon]|nr:hypothetical protein [Nitrososphaerota archaeon]